MKIAIDGPAGAGKSTIAKMLANKFHMNYLDTGSMYRAIAYALIERGVDVTDKDTVIDRLDGLNIAVVYTDEGQRVFVNSVDVTPYIRTPRITKASSDVAVIPEVRLKLVKIQRETAQKYDIVMDGRDIGTYVLPDADIKLYITASVEERARRRQRDFEAQGIWKDLNELCEEITERDHNDSTREFAPLRQAEDAILIDTTDMPINKVLRKISDLVKGVNKR